MRKEGRKKTDMNGKVETLGMSRALLVARDMYRGGERREKKDNKHFASREGEGTADLPEMRNSITSTLPWMAAACKGVICSP